MIFTKQICLDITLLAMLFRVKRWHMLPLQKELLGVEKLAGLHTEAIDYGNVPGCTYATPEIASVGMTEAKAKEAGYELKIGKFPFSASGKATASGTTDGFVKVIFDAKYGEWLGCHMIGAGVTDMIAEAVCST